MTTPNAELTLRLFQEDCITLYHDYECDDLKAAMIERASERGLMVDADVRNIVTMAACNGTRAMPRPAEPIREAVNGHAAPIDMGPEPPPADPPGDERDAEPVEEQPSVTPLAPFTPAKWKGTEPTKQRFLASARIPCGDLTLITGNGGSGKTEILVSLLMSAAAELGDWLGSVVEPGDALFISCEEPEENARERVERIAKHRRIDPYAINRLHIHCPDLDDTWLATADRHGRISKTTFFLQLEEWVRLYRPLVVGIDSVAAVFDGEAIARRQVRAFLAMLRKIARKYDCAIVLLDHPSVRGMADGTGTANSVDWRNSVRCMLSLSEPRDDDPDVRELVLKKTNRGRPGEKVQLRWNGLTFVTEAAAAASPYRAAAERDVDELFLRLLDVRLGQARDVTDKKGPTYAPAIFESMSDNGGFKSKAFAAAMERLLIAGKIAVQQFGPPSKQRSRLVRAVQKRAEPAQ